MHATEMMMFCTVLFLVNAKLARQHHFECSTCNGKQWSAFFRSTKDFVKKHSLGRITQKKPSSLDLDLVQYEKQLSCLPINTSSPLWCVPKTKHKEQSGSSRLQNSHLANSAKMRANKKFITTNKWNESFTHFNFPSLWVNNCLIYQVTTTTKMKRLFRLEFKFKDLAHPPPNKNIKKRVHN